MTTTNLYNAFMEWNGERLARKFVRNFTRFKYMKCAIRMRVETAWILTNYINDYVRKDRRADELNRININILDFFDKMEGR